MKKKSVEIMKFSIFLYQNSDLTVFLGLVFRHDISTDLSPISTTNTFLAIALPFLYFHNHTFTSSLFAFWIRCMKNKCIEYSNESYQIFRFGHNVKISFWYKQTFFHMPTILFENCINCFLLRLSLLFFVHQM